MKRTKPEDSETIARGIISKRRTVSGQAEEAAAKAGKTKASRDELRIKQQFKGI